MVKHIKDNSWIEFGNKPTSFRDKQKMFYKTLKNMRNSKSNMLKNITNKNENILTGEKV